MARIPTPVNLRYPEDTPQKSNPNHKKWISGQFFRISGKKTKCP